MGKGMPVLIHQNLDGRDIEFGSECKIPGIRATPAAIPAAGLLERTKKGGCR